MSNPWVRFSPISVTWTINVDKVLEYIKVLVVKLNSNLNSRRSYMFGPEIPYVFNEAPRNTRWMIKGECYKLSIEMIIHFFTKLKHYDHPLLYQLKHYDHLLIKHYDHPLIYQIKHHLCFTGSVVKACCGGEDGRYKAKPNVKCGGKGSTTCENPSTYANWDGISGGST
ncbi:hypothetical protein YC2023_054905 [Brassica napus]